MDIITAIRTVLTFPHINPALTRLMESYLSEHQVFTKGEGNPYHVNVFFFPYDRERGKIYLGHHKKADDWIPPGGHIEPGETPVEAAIREMQEELATTITLDQLTLWNLSYKYIGRPEMGCLGHYDLWYLVDADSSIDYAFDQGEYYAAGWFSIEEGLNKITKNPNFKQIISDLVVT